MFRAPALACVGRVSVRQASGVSNSQEAHDCIQAVSYDLTWIRCGLDNPLGQFQLLLAASLLSLLRRGREVSVGLLLGQEVPDDLE